MRMKKKLVNQERMIAVANAQLCDFSPYPPNINIYNNQSGWNKIPVFYSATNYVAISSYFISSYY